MNVLRENVFFLKKNVFEFFLALERRTVILWRWISNRLSKNRLICLEELFQGVCFFSVTKLTVWYFLSEFEGDFLKKLEKWIFDGEKSALLSQVDSRLPEWLFAELFRWKTIHCKKVFATWAEVRYVLSKLSHRFVKSASLRPDEFIEGKYVFLWKNIGLHIFVFSVVEMKIVWLCQKKSTTSSSLRFHLSKDSFQRGNFFLQKKQTIC